MAYVFDLDFSTIGLTKKELECLKRLNKAPVPQKVKTEGEIVALRELKFCTTGLSHTPSNPSGYIAEITKRGESYLEYRKYNKRMRVHNIIIQVLPIIISIIALIISYLSYHYTIHNDSNTTKATITSAIQLNKNSTNTIDSNTESQK